MKRVLARNKRTVVTVLLTVAYLVCFPLQSMVFAEECNVEAHFTPNESMQSVILHQLATAKTSVHLSLYGITNQALTNELIQLHQNGVSVELLVDKRQADLPSSLTTALESAGILVVVKPTSELEHHKYCIIDHRVVIIGSWNWSNRADRQDNSEVILSSCNHIIQAFESNFNAIKDRDLKDSW